MRKNSLSAMLAALGMAAAIPAIAQINNEQASPAPSPGIVDETDTLGDPETGDTTGQTPTELPAAGGGGMAK